VPRDLRKIETKHARLVVTSHREKARIDEAEATRRDRFAMFVTDPVHPLLIPENREALLELGLPRNVYEDPEACVKDASRSRQTIDFGGTLREVDIWEFRSKRGGHVFRETPRYRGRYRNPEPSWIGRVAL